MQTSYASQARIKKRVPTIYDLQHPYKIPHVGTMKSINYKISVVDAWLYRIVIVALAAGILKLVIGALN